LSDGARVKKEGLLCREKDSIQVAEKRLKKNIFWRVLLGRDVEGEGEKRETAEKK